MGCLPLFTKIVVMISTIGTEDKKISLTLAHTSYT